MVAMLPGRYPALSRLTRLLVRSCVKCELELNSKADFCSEA